VDPEVAGSKPVTHPSIPPHNHGINRLIRRRWAIARRLWSELIPIDISSEDKLIVTMPHGSYYPFTVNPGEVEFNSRAGLNRKIQESVTIHARAGEAYYLKTDFRVVSTYATQASLEVMPLEDGSDEIKECRLILEPPNNNAKNP
jgi:hypothetical protein